MGTDTTTIDTLQKQGFVVIPQVFSQLQIVNLREQLAAVLVQEQQGVLHADTEIYAARNVIQLFPAVQDVWQQEPLPNLLTLLLGIQFGLVRALYFDKPPGRTWGLPWHQDLKIAVRPNPPPSDLYSTPRLRYGIPHAEAPLEVLENMVTLRIHLDDMTSENGPLQVQPGSHRYGKQTISGESVSILGQAGDVLLMRPLLVHCSGRSSDTTLLHRRILHLEFASQRELPDAWEWHDFLAYH